MSAVDPLKKGLHRQRFRTIGAALPAEADEPAGEPARRAEVLKCSYRPEDADFYCWKYGVWYNVLDCCYRHSGRTYPGCANCGQGRGNLKANRDRYVAQRLRKECAFRR